MTRSHSVAERDATLKSLLLLHKAPSTAGLVAGNPEGQLLPMGLVAEERTVVRAMECEEPVMAGMDR